MGLLGRSEDLSEVAGDEKAGRGRPYEAFVVTQYAAGAVIISMAVGV